MENRHIRLKQLHERIMAIAEQVRPCALSQFNPQSWRPAVNAYHCGKSIRVCVDLAGVDEFEIKVQSRQMVIRGHRQAPEPIEPEKKGARVLALEIDYGPFEREITFEPEVDADRVVTEQKNGLLWIILPLSTHS
ncbi:MAG: small heat shock protein [Verrucomicrobiales bacterium]|nr:small heat shock protein [Verrucomicrobiales bacterium]